MTARLIIRGLQVLAIAAAACFVAVAIVALILAGLITIGAPSVERMQTAALLFAGYVRGMCLGVGCAMVAIFLQAIAGMIARAP